MTEKPEVFTVHENQFGDAEVDHVDLTELQKEVTTINYSLAATVEQNKQELFKIKGVLGPDGNYLDVGHLIFQLQDQVKALTEQVKTMQESSSSALQTQEEYNEMIKQNQYVAREDANQEQSTVQQLSEVVTALQKHGIMKG